MIDPMEILKEENVDPDADLNDFASANRCAKAIREAVKNEARLTNKKAIYDTKLRVVNEEITPDDDFLRHCLSRW